jgi:tape measure domain-containing protein
MAKSGDLNFTVNFDTQQAGAEISRLLTAFASGSEAAGNKLNRALGGTIEQQLVIRTTRGDNGVKELKSELITVRSEADKLKNALLQAQKVQPLSVTSLRQQVNTAKTLRDSIAKYGIEIDNVNRKSISSAQISSQWIQADEKVKQLTQSLRLVESANRGLGGALADGFSRFLQVGDKLQEVVGIFQSINIAVGALTSPIKAATNALADLDAFALSFEAIGQGSDVAVTGLGKAQEIALGLGVNIKTVRESFQQLSPVILNTGGSLEDVSSITESLSSRFAAFGLNADKSRRVLNGVIQAFAKGKLQAEELTQQISEADPAFKTDFAQALFKVRGELGDLSSEIRDGTVANLERLVKSGKITGSVLRTVIPEISKSEALFGKLGPSAQSAVNALKAGEVTINQVKANFDSLNQLNLERLSKLAEPLVFVLFDIQAAVIDFTKRISELAATRQITDLFISIGKAALNTVQAFLAISEAVINVTGVLAGIINFFAKIPGAVELAGIALVVKFFNPIKATIGGVTRLTQALSDLADTSRGIRGGGPVVGGAAVTSAKNNEVALRSLKALKAELSAPVSSGIVDTYNKNIDAAIKSDNVLEGLSKREQKRLVKLQAYLEELTKDYASRASELREIKLDPSAPDFKDEIREFEQPLKETRKKITSIQRQISEIIGKPLDFELRIPVREIDQVSDLFRSYENTAVDTYARARAASEINLLALEAQTTALIKQRDAAKANLDTFRKTPSLPGAAEARTRFEALDAAVEKNQRKITSLQGSYKDLIVSQRDISGALDALESNQKLSEDQFRSLSTEIDVTDTALSNYRNTVDGLRKQQVKLIQEQQRLSSELVSGKVKRGSQQYDLLKTRLSEVQVNLRNLAGEIELNDNVAGQFERRSVALRTALDEAGKSGKGFRGLQSNLARAATEGTGLNRVIGQVGTGIINFGQRALKTLNGLRLAIAGIGKELVFLAAITLAMQAFAKASAIAKNESEKNKTTIDSLNASTEKLTENINQLGSATGSSAIDFTSNLSAIDKILITIGSTLKRVTDAFARLFSSGGGAKEFDKVSGQIKETSGEVNVLAVALAGAATGFTFLRNPLGLVIGGITGLTIGLFSASANITDIQEKGKGFRDGLAEQYVATKRLGDALLEYAKIAGSQKLKPGAPGTIGEKVFADQSIALGDAIGDFKNYKKSIEGLGATNKQLKSDISEQLDAITLLRKKLRLKPGEKLDTNAMPAYNLTPREEEERRLALELESRLAKLEELRQSQELLTEQEKELLQQLDQLKAAYPQLTDEIIINGRSIANVSDEYKSAKAALEQLDPKQLGADFDASARRAGNLKQELEAIEQRAQDQELLGYINSLTFALASNQIPRSLQNINNLAQALENRVLLLDINSPELPKVIADLTVIQRGVDLISGKKAEIEINVISKGLKSGDLVRTQSQLGRLQAAFNTLADTQVFGTEQFEQTKRMQAALSTLANFVSKTREEIASQTRSVLASIGENRIKIALDTGPLREASVLVNQTFNNVQQSAQDYKTAVQQAESLKASGIASQKEINGILGQASLAFYNTMVAAKAQLEDAAREVSKQLSAAKQSLAGEVLSNPQFFTSEERQQAIDEIDRKIQEISSREGIVVTFRGSQEEILQQKQAFIQARERAAELEDTIAQSQAALARLQAGIDELSALTNTVGTITFEQAVNGSADLVQNMSNAADEANRLNDILNSLPTQITIDVNYNGSPPGRWTGGPVLGGTSYKVNELGQEGFLSNGGHLSAINRPKNSLWRPPVSGTVIPAHIWKQINNGNRANVRPISGDYSKRDNSGAAMGMLASYLSASSAIAEKNRSESARVQGHQARQIAKLSRAVAKLADKNWNVGVNVRNTGSTAFMAAVNSRL